jgi:hypothetical protein
MIVVRYVDDSAAGGVEAFRLEADGGYLPGRIRPL